MFTDLPILDPLLLEITIEEMQERLQKQEEQLSIQGQLIHTALDKIKKLEQKYL